MKKLIALMLALSLAVGLSAFASAEGQITLKIAHIGPLTGAAAVYGMATSRGAKLAADEINALGGKYRIEIIDEDDTHDAEKAVYAYSDALDKGAQMIIGTTTTTPCIAVGAEAFNDRVFMLTPSASSTDVTKDKDNVFQVCFTDPAQGAASAEYIAEHKLAVNVAVIYNNADAYSTGIYNTFKDKAKEVGLNIVSTTTFTEDTTDFSVQVADAKNNGAELVFLPIYYQPASTILKQAHDAEYAPVFFGVDGMDGILTMEGFDASLAEGVLLLTPSASSEAVTADKDNVYQVCFTDPAQGAASAEYINANQLATKIAVIYNNADAYSTGIYNTFKDKAAELGMEVVSVTTFTDETVDFSVQVADAQNNGADLVFLPIYYTPASMILQTANANGYKPVFFGVDGMDGILSIEGFDTSLAEGVMLLTPFSADAEDEKTKKFVARYQELYGEVPNQFAADAYDGVYALVAAAELAGVKNGDKAEDICDGMIAAMQQLTIEGVTGTMTWNESGAVSKTPTAVIIENGVYVGFSK